MTKKHLIFPIHTYPKDPPEEVETLFKSQFGTHHIGYYDQSHGGPVVTDRNSNHYYPEDGDTYIILSEGEVVDYGAQLENEAMLVATKMLDVIKEQEG